MLLILLTTNSLNLSERDTGGGGGGEGGGLGQDGTSECAHHLITKTGKSSLELSQFAISSQNVRMGHFFWNWHCLTYSDDDNNNNNNNNNNNRIAVGREGVREGRGR